MKGDRRSRTAERVAIRRAAHQLVDRPLIFEDPLALRIIGKENEAKLRENLGDEGQLMSRAMRAFMATRSRISEDALASAVSNGVRQYVILGAGLDTFAYRNRFESVGLRVFEVDFPGTQTWKREQLAAGGIDVPASMTFAPVDFENQTVAEGLSAAGWDPHSPTYFSWLGVVVYLTQEAIDGTLSFIAHTPKGGGVVFDYGIKPSLLSLVPRGFYHVMAAKVASIGEPWLSTFDPVDLVTHLRQLGFSVVEDLTQAKLNHLFFEGRKDGLTLGSLAHIMRAWV